MVDSAQFDRFDVVVPEARRQSLDRRIEIEDQAAGNWQAIMRPFNSSIVRSD